MRKPEEIRTSFAATDELNGLRSFFLVGIGGAGMSAVARMLTQRGFKVRGSDSTRSPETERLESEGFSVVIGHRSDSIDTEIDALIVTDAIDLERSPEVAAARTLGLPFVRRSQALGWLLKAYRVIAVTGTHGKTTTTGMIGAGLIAAGLDPLVVVGAMIPEWNGPVREGSGVYAVVEACEAYDALHDIDPFVVVLTNLELDHVDFHGNFENLRSSIVRFVDRVPESGALIYCADDGGAAEVAKMSHARCWGYGKEASLESSLMPSERHMALPGSHNRLNASAALCTAGFLHSIGESFDLRSVASAVEEFRGAERRLQVIHSSDTIVMDDYAHHPTEIRASIQALRERYFCGQPGFEGRRLVVVFQPHLYSRTAPLIAEFADALSDADEVYLTDIYPARESPMPGISSARIAGEIVKPVHYVPSRHLLPRMVAEAVRPGDVIVGMGAGNISEFAPAMAAEIDRAKLVRSAISGSRSHLSVVVLYGGDSSEREVSLHSGRAVHAALERLGHRSKLVDMTEVLFSRSDLNGFIGVERPDVVFLAGHGTNAEDGAIQGLLELLHLPYTGSGIQASAIAMDKSLTKRILGSHGIRVPDGAQLETEDSPFRLAPPLIVKPNAQGSTVGLSFVEKGGDVCHAIRKAFAYDRSVLVEEWIVGMEISTPVLCDRALPPVEIVPRQGRYDFKNKYLPGATEEVVPARLPAATLLRAQEIALQAHQALGCSGATRTDAIVRGDEIFVLEVNTLPGLTSTSLLPNSAAAVGIVFDELCQTLIEDALRRHALKD